LYNPLKDEVERRQREREKNARNSRRVDKRDRNGRSEKQFISLC
jgi:hypothetical protein